MIEHRISGPTQGHHHNTTPTLSTLLPAHWLPLWLLLLPLLWLPSAAHATPSMLEIHFLSIGQGDGILLRAPSGRNVLIDLGPPGAGKRIAQYLKQRNISRINLLLISHPHLDHYGGWSQIIRQFPINTYIDPGFPSTNVTYRKLLRRLRRKKIRSFHVKQDQILDLGGGAKLRVLWPGKQFIRQTRSDANSNSVVVRLEYKKLRVLFTGDAEDLTEQRLLQQAQYLPSHVLKVAHHGSRHSTSKQFLRIVKPKIAVISCGRNNVYRHPHSATLRRLRNAGIATFITAKHGDIILRSDGNKMWLSTRGGDRQKAVRTIQLSALVPGKAPPMQQTQHRLAVQNERGNWYQTRRQGRKAYGDAQMSEAKGGYIAARHSRYFHRRSCQFSASIPRRTRVTYRSRRDALRRKRPAHDCKP